MVSDHHRLMSIRTDTGEINRQGYESNERFLLRMIDELSGVMQACIKAGIIDIDDEPQKARKIIEKMGAK